MSEKESKTPEFEPPQACVHRIIKSVLPENAQIGKDAKAAFARSAGVFILYLTACANEFCKDAKRQTISAQDVLSAIKELEFDEFEDKLNDFLRAFREEQERKKASKISHKRVREMDEELDEKEDTEDNKGDNEETVEDEA
mmetsp:Transcript_9226/g.13858  ORF Transcript_9226/g.13858 Transcript_9226/m.13858 type:complete len:141 (+) Transcript_9226:85-507(+)|eukprot:CAMPEP_0171452406 /NCGR_PEP_ID=MMETSP0945-20130129/528_1 /TAXON_ID=109269 /ORGANISM="Vaucheria litorea, Strain CCMP2940" /LENGTH=140 /DNA_ID=CAMNT_0011977069 /DNA_START=60 /DNA_END=482 /DNA_ORIENTATION=+